MPLHQAVILAILQGFTEFLPISSSAHLALAPWLFGWKDQGLTFDIALHFGTLMAVLIYFFRDWLQITAQAFGIRYSPNPELELNRKLLWFLALGSVPVGVAGLALEHYSETVWRTPFVIGSTLVTLGVLMGVADRIGKRTRSIASLRLPDALVIGIAQAFAIVPGVSRSGVTMTTGLFRGLDRTAAARFSFLLSTPTTAAAAAKAFYDLYKVGGVPPESQLSFIVGIAVSAIVGCLVIAFFLRFLKAYGLRVFVFYRIAFGIIVIALAFVRPPAA